MDRISCTRYQWLFQRSYAWWSLVSSTHSLSSDRPLTPAPRIPHFPLVFFFFFFSFSFMSRSRSWRFYVKNERLQEMVNAFNAGDETSPNVVTKMAKGFFADSPSQATAGRRPHIPPPISFLYFIYSYIPSHVRFMSPLHPLSFPQLPLSLNVYFSLLCFCSLTLLSWRGALYSCRLLSLLSTIDVESSEIITPRTKGHDGTVSCSNG